MKNFRTSLFATALFFISTVSSAQQSVIEGKNIIKLNLPSLALKHYMVQYERVINNRQSFAISVGYSPSVDLPFKGTLMDQFSDNEDAKNAIESTRFDKITITPEYRFYLSKKGAPSGFYIAPFARYTTMTIEQDYKFTPGSGIEHTAHLSGKFSGIGGGVMVGAQWLLGKNVTLDWWIAGPFIGAMKADFHATDDMSDMSPADKADLKKDIESVEIPLWKTEATIGENTIDAKLTGPFYGIRGFGVSVGIRF